MKLKFGDFDDRYTDYKNSKVVILPVCFDETCTWQKGCKYGPISIIDASKQLENYDIELGKELYTVGIHCLNPIENITDPKTLIDEVYLVVKEQLDKDKFTIVLGGEHTVALGSIKACIEKFSPLTVVQFDAHLDNRKEYNGSKYNHACVMYRVRELNDYVLQIGIRSADYLELTNVNEEEIIYIHELINIIKWDYYISQKIKTENIYITFDLDVFDPSIMPCVGTPEPGGLMWYETLKLLKNLFINFNVVGIDIVEFMPINNLLHPNYLVAKLIYKIVGYKYFIV
mgnify:CR=1 FL=1